MTANVYGITLATLLGWINVKASPYSAKGDGATDDTAAVQSAINAASNGQLVYFPAGTYLVSSTLTLSSASGVVYLGEDEDQTTVKMKSGANLQAIAATTGWLNNTATSSASPLHIRHLTFDGNSSGQTSGAGHGVVLQSYYSNIEYCIFQNTLGDGLRFDADDFNGSTQISNTAVENKIHRCQFRSNGGNGININDPSRNKLTDGWISDCAVQSPGQNGILVGAGSGWIVEGCHVYQVPMSGIRVDRPFQSRITNNYVESCGSSSTSGYYFLIDCVNGQANDGGFGSTISNNTCYFQGPAGNAGSTLGGIGFQSASGGNGNVSITGNQLYCTGITGIPAILLQNQNSGASLTAKVSGNNLVGWSTNVSQVSNGGSLTASGDNITPLPVALGGTGATTAGAALAALNGVPIPNTRTITSSTVTANAWDVIEANAASNAITVTLPSNTAGTKVIVKKTDSSANTVTISGTVDGVANPTLTYQWQSIELIADGTHWYRTVRPTLSAIVDYPATTDARYVPTSTNLDNTNGPADQGFIAWTIDAGVVGGATNPASGGVRLGRIILRRPATISYIWLSIVTAGSGLTSGQSFVGLYSSSGTLLASSADQSASWASAGIKQIALTSSYSAAAGTYFVALLTNGTTPPQFAYMSGVTNSPANANLTVSTGRSLSGPSSQTTLPASITMSSNTFNIAVYWIAVS